MSKKERRTYIVLQNEKSAREHEYETCRKKDPAVFSDKWKKKLVMRVRSCSC